MTERDYETYWEPGSKPIKAWVKGVYIEDQARQQLENIASMPFIHKHVAAMPDVHLGKGATVGSVIATKGAVIPAAVGVDIGCGMMAVRTSLTANDMPDTLVGLRSDLERLIPHGRGQWTGSVPTHVKMAWWHLFPHLGYIQEKHPKIHHPAPQQQLGTMGGGNHFCEICLDEEGRVWIMLHSGSRGIGNKIGAYFIEKAKEEMRRWFINLPDQDLAYFPEGTQHFNDYREAVAWAQNYALANRRAMMQSAIEALRLAVPGKEFSTDDVAVNCHHNYVEMENHFGENVFVTRKGAVRARKGDLGIIPGSMGAKSFIVRGKGNPESFHSCSHGAGRMMSRTEASKRFTLEDHAKATAHVECRKDKGVIDETPAAYKDIDLVMKAQESLVEIVHTLRQIVCVKG